MTKLLQLNARHSAAVWSLLEKSVKEQGVDIVAVQDPPMEAKLPIGKWEGFHFLFGRGSSPQVAIAIKQSIGFISLDLGCKRVCGLVIQVSGFACSILSAYLQHSSGEGHLELSQSLGVAHARAQGIVLCADCNGHSPLWGPRSVSLNAVGELVENILLQENLIILNNSDSPPTFRGDRGQVSWIDITAASPNIVSRVVSWRVMEDLEVGSDHIPVVTCLALGPRRVAIRRVLNWKTTDWEAFNGQLLSRLGEGPHGSLSGPEDIDTSVEYVTSAIQQTIETCVPVKRICSYSRTGWTPELTRLRTEMRTARRRWMRYRASTDRERYLRSRSLFRRRLTEARREAWRQLCESTSSEDYWRLYRKVTRPAGDQGVEDLQTESGTASTDQEKATALAKAFFPPLPPASPNQQEEELDTSWATHRPPGPVEHEPVTSEELRRAIKRLRVSAAPGLDRVSVLCLKKCMMILIPWLCLICNASLACSYFPRAWRRARVIALRKPGKDSYEVPRSYRPISLLSNLGKVLEKLVNTRLMRILERTRVLAPHQYGFRAGREVTDACTRFALDIVSAFRRGQIVQAVTLDIQSAYDTVWHAELIRKLVRIGLDPYLVFWLDSFLSDRVCLLCVGDSELEVMPECGLPQGSPLSVTLFLIFINDLLQSLGHIHMLRSQGFADDLALWVPVMHRSGLIGSGLRRGLREVDRWAQCCRIRFSPQKCICICFRGRNVRVQRSFIARLHGETLPHDRAVRYLGVWFDEGLLWSRHITEVILRARARLWQLRRIVGCEWGVCPGLFMRLVRGAVLPGLLFAAPVWASVLRLQDRLRRLDSTLALAARMAFGLERFTSTEASLALAGLMPARQQILQHLVAYMLRRRRAILTGALPLELHRSYVTPDELGFTWFQRSVRGHTIPQTLPGRRRLIRAGVERALTTEWNRRWRASETGRQLFTVLHRVGGGWHPDDADVARRQDLTLVARFMTGHYHLGPWAPTRDPDELELCPLCGEIYSREHLILECLFLDPVRRDILGPVLGSREVGLAWLTRSACAPLGRFLRVARDEVSMCLEEPVELG